MDEDKSQRRAVDAQRNGDGRDIVQPGKAPLKTHFEHIFKRAKLVGPADAVHELRIEAILQMLFFERNRSGALEYVHLERFALAQKEGYIRLFKFFLDELNGRIEEAVEVGRTEYRFVEAGCEVNDVEFLDKILLCRNEIIAEYIYLFRLPLALFIQLLCKPAKPYMSLLVISHYQYLLQVGEHGFLQCYHIRKFGFTTHRL